MTFYFTGTE